jgi:AraC family transcriptional regulator
MGLKIAHRTAPHAPPRAPIRLRSFEVEHVQLRGSDGYDYAHAGERHYLAIHDIVLSDGELRLDGAPVERSLDLRGAITFVPAGCEITGWSEPADRPNNFTLLYFDQDDLADDYAAKFRNAAVRPFVHHRSPPLAQTLLKIRDLATSETPADPLYAETLCLAAALEVLEVEAVGVSGLDDHRTRLVNDFIVENLHRPISLDELAQVAGMSRFHFVRSFKARMGLTPYAFAMGLRMSRARDLLSVGTTPIEMVARAVGFTNDATFRRAFAKAFGVSPSQFRRRAP